MIIKSILITTCWWPNKGTNLKANHNPRVPYLCKRGPVDDPTKVLIWKQITTNTTWIKIMNSCWWPNKGTNLKANHNNSNEMYIAIIPVDDPTKVLIWKQITTIRINNKKKETCWWPNKGTNLKANHNKWEIKI